FSVDTSSQTVSFKGESALSVPYKIGNTDLNLGLNIDANLTPADKKKLRGKFAGKVKFAGNEFSTTVTLDDATTLEIKQQPLKEALTFTQFLKELTGQSIALPAEVPDLTISDLSGSVNFTTKELSFSCDSLIDWDIFKNGNPLKSTVSVSFGRVRQQDLTYKYEGTLHIKSQGEVILFSDLKVDNFDGKLHFDGSDWGVSGDLDASLFGKKFLLEAGVVKDETERSITLKSKISAEQSLVKVDVFELAAIDFDLAITEKKSIAGSLSAEIAIAGEKAKLQTAFGRILIFSIVIPELDLSKLSKQVLGVALPKELPDIVLKDIAFSVDPIQKTFIFDGEVSGGDWKLNAGTASVGISKIKLYASKDNKGNTKFDITVAGSGKITDDLLFDEVNFTFGYDEGWLLKGSVTSSVFERKFILGAAYEEQTLTLSYEKVDQTPLLEVDGLGSIHISNVSLVLDQNESGLNWDFSSTGALKIQEFIDVGGELGFKQSNGDTTFSFTPENASLTVPLFPLPSGEKLSFHFDFGPFIISKRKVAQKMQWGFEASVSFSCPLFYQVLPAEIQQVLPEKITTRFIARGKSVSIVTDKILDARIDIPPIRLAEDAIIPIGLTRFSLTNLAILIGKDLSLSLDLGLGLPASLNKNFGVKDDGSPILDLFNTFD
ncbi:MAG: hypothetical protein AAFO69_17115, partial [Bacteroidota bacterium]